MRAALVVLDAETHDNAAVVIGSANYETVASYFEKEYPEAFALLVDPLVEMEPDMLWCLEATSKAGLCAKPLMNPRTKTLDYAFPQEVLEACFSRH